MNYQTSTLSLDLPTTVEPQINEVAWDRVNLFVKSTVCYNENLDNYKGFEGKQPNCLVYQGMFNDCKICLHK